MAANSAVFVRYPVPPGEASCGWTRFVETGQLAPGGGAQAGRAGWFLAGPPAVRGRVWAGRFLAHRGPRQRGSGRRPAAGGS